MSIHELRVGDLFTYFSMLGIVIRKDSMRSECVWVNLDSILFDRRGAGLWTLPVELRGR
jgi:hypothetical protein